MRITRLHKVTLQIETTFLDNNHYDLPWQLMAVVVVANAPDADAAIRDAKHHALSHSYEHPDQCVEYPPTGARTVEVRRLDDGDRLRAVLDTDFVISSGEVA